METLEVPVREVKTHLEGKSAEEIAAALKELPAEKLAQVKQACFAAGVIEVWIEAVSKGCWTFNRKLDAQGCI